MSRRGKAIHPASLIYRIPLLIAVVSAIGLGSGLLGDGAWDALSWVALSTPVVIAAFYGTRRSS